MEVTTVRGPVAVEDTGMVLPHEHMFLNLMDEYRGQGLLNDFDAAVDELNKFTALGGGTIVDVTPAGLTSGSYGRQLSGPSSDNHMQAVSGSRAVANVRALESLSLAAGVHIVAGTGHYREPFLDKQWFDRTSVQEIAEFLIRDIEEGFPGTNSKAGIIGEIGADKWYISAAEERSFRAAARAHLRTGLKITTHAARWSPLGFAILDLLESEGVAPDNVVIGHADTVPDPEYALLMAKRGVFVQLDSFYACKKGGAIQERDLQTRINTIVELVASGHIEQILISHDICLSDHLSSKGGSGLTFISEHVIPQLLERGITDEEVEMITKTNPSRILTR